MYPLIELNSPRIMYSFFLLDRLFYIEIVLLVVTNLHHPGLEPGSLAWKANMLTPTPMMHVYLYI